MGTQHSVLPDVLTRINLSIEKNGDLPTQRKTLTALRNLSIGGRVNPEVATSVLLADPIMSLRALSLYKGVHGHSDLNSAMQLHGLSPLLDLEFSTVVLTDYRDLGLRNPVFLDQLRVCIFTGLLAELLLCEWGIAPDESIYFAASLLASGPLLLSYHYPRLYQSGIERATKLDITVQESISQMLGMPILGLSISTAHSLGVAEGLQALTEKSYSLLSNQKKIPSETTTEVFSGQEIHACALAGAYLLAQLISDSEVDLARDHAISTIAQLSGIEENQLFTCLEKLPAAYAEFVRHSALPNLELPTKLDTLLYYGTPTAQSTQQTPKSHACSPYLERMQRMLHNGSSLRAIIGCALEAIVDALPFDRAVLLLPDPDCKRLYGAARLGADTPVATHLVVTKLDRDSIVNATQRAFIEGRTVVRAKPLLIDAALSVSIPIGLDSWCIGVILADRLARDDRRESLGDSVIEELRIISSVLHDCVLQILNPHSRHDPQGVH